MRTITKPERHRHLAGIALLLGAALGAPSLAAAAGLRGGAEAALGSTTLIGNTLLLGDTFDGRTADRTASHFFQRTFPNDINPVLGLMSSATVTADFGRISAFASAEATGFNVVGVSGVSSAANATVFDSFVVRSGTLAIGSAVDLTFDLDVSGNGRFFSSYLIKQIGKATGGPVSGPPKRLDLSLSGSFDGIGGSTSGVIQALVGEQYTLEYSLRVDANVGTSRLNGGTVFSVSDYAHTAHFYAQPKSAAAFLQVETGFNYTRPAPVPLPATVWMLLPALGVLRRYCCRTRDASMAA